MQILTYIIEKFWIFPRIYPIKTQIFCKIMFDFSVSNNYKSKNDILHEYIIVRDKIIQIYDIIIDNYKTFDITDNIKQNKLLFDFFADLHKIILNTNYPKYIMIKSAHC